MPYTKIICFIIFKIGNILFKPVLGFPYKGILLLFPGFGKSIL